MKYKKYMKYLYILLAVIISLLAFKWGYDIQQIKQWDDSGLGVAFTVISMGTFILLALFRLHEKEK